MIDLDQVVLRRIDEAAATYRFSSQHESEGWSPARLPPGLGRARLRSRCLAGDCARRVVGRHGYCHAHAQKIARGVALDRDVLLRRAKVAGVQRDVRVGPVSPRLPQTVGLRPRRASLATERAHAGRAAPAPSRRAPFTPNVHEAP